MREKFIFFKKISDKINNNKRAFRIALFAVSILIVAVFSLILFNSTKKEDYIKLDGATLTYRVYDGKDWSEWFKNGQIAKTNNKCIYGFQAKIDSEIEGHIFYNTYSYSQDFTDNSSYDGEDSDDLYNPIHGIKIGISDALYNKYALYYRTYNLNDKWLGWSNYFEIISGDEKNCINKIQIKMYDINTIFDIGDKEPNRYFTGGDNDE